MRGVAPTFLSAHPRIRKLTVSLDSLVNFRSSLVHLSVSRNAPLLCDPRGGGLNACLARSIDRLAVTSRCTVSVLSLPRLVSIRGPKRFSLTKAGSETRANSECTR